MLCTPKYYDDFEGLWRSTLSFLDCAYVLKGLKFCGIDCVDRERLPLLRKFCRVNGLCFELSDYKIIHQSEKSKGGFSNACSRVSIDCPCGNYAVFLSIDRIIAQLAKHYHAISDHANLGQLLGYPKCCLDFFCKHVEEASQKNMDFILYALADTKQYDFYTNKALRYFDIAIISHFPCSLNCPASISIAQKNLYFLQEEHPQIATFFEKHLKSMVIYTEDQGIFFSNDYSIKGDIVEYRDLKATVENSLFHKLKNTNQITIISHNSLIVNQELLSSNIGILLFK